MKTSILSLLPLLLLLISCGTTKTGTESTLFEFQVEDETYQIIGINTSDGEAVNDLVQREGREVTIWVRDSNQDGFMDLVLRGNITLEEANQIYHQGIRIAAEMGKYQQKEYPRSYLYDTDQYTFTIISVMGSRSEVNYNQFLIYSKQELQEVRLYDRDMDGVLDSYYEDDPEYTTWQEQYRKTLDRGIADQRIERRDGRYVVKLRGSSMQPSPVSGTIFRFN
ncbi:MAG: hypothetical protein JJU46_11140 [Balneolaceae bacterium]|nr:hypothetical protein [Balneolaceae bacterium]